MTTPPRWIETVLASLGADPEFRDSVIGDMNEEFAERERYDGKVQALRWYYREAARTTPYLLRDSLQRTGLRGGLHVLGILASAYTITLMVALIGLATVGGIARAAGVQLVTQQMMRSPSAGFMLAILALDGFAAFFAGYVAACLDVRAPLRSAIATGAAWVMLVLGSLAVATITHPSQPVSPLPLWFRGLAGLMIASAPALGGILRVTALADRQRA